MIYAVDFDGTLCENAYPKIGAPKQTVIDFCKGLHEYSHNLILWTCREGVRLNEAVAWCNAQGLTFDAVNANLPERIAEYGGDCRKLSADYYIDDKNLFFTEVNSMKLMY